MIRTIRSQQNSFIAHAIDDDVAGFAQLVVAQILGAWQIFGELGAGAGLDTSNDRLFGLFQAGIGLAFQLQ